MNAITNFIHGRFGKKVLKGKYREIWVKFTYSCIGVIAVLAFFAMIQFMSWCSNFINYVFR